MKLNEIRINKMVIRLRNFPSKNARSISEHLRGNLISQFKGFDSTIIDQYNGKIDNIDAGSMKLHNSTPSSKIAEEIASKIFKSINSSNTKL
jgi:phosphoglycerate dehydrogenase-like enzyme